MDKNISFKDMFVKGAVIFNPVLIQLVGLCPVVAAATTLTGSLMLSVALCADLILTCVIASSFFKKLPRWVRVALYLLIGLVLICPVLWFIEAKTLIDLSLGIKIYLPLIAINSVTAVHCEQFAVKNSVKLAFFDAAAVGIGGSFVCILAGTLREIFGSGSLAGVKLELPVVFSGLTLPFGCLILLGFMAAALKALIAYKYPQYAEKAVPAAKLVEKQEESAPETVEVEIFDDIPAIDKQPEETNQIKNTADTDLEEFFKSLGLFDDEKGDEQ
ncbi:MAG: hypothetical protein IJF57_04455 [Clostridia bacterium]|nr:hypothetical protein [Clostridia bacterium]